MSRSVGGTRIRSRPGMAVAAAVGLLFALGACSSSHIVSGPGSGAGNTGISGGSGAGTGTGPFTVPARADGVVWLVSSRALRELSANADAAAILRAGKIYEIVGPRDAAVPGWTATLVQDFPSYATLQQVVTSGGLVPGVSAILYDNEDWSSTPASEQVDPGHYMQLAASLAHAHGLTLITTPALDLTRVIARSSSDNPQAFISAGIGRQAAVGQLVDIQAQSLQVDVQGYTSFVASVASQVHSANPGATVIAGVTTRDGGTPSVIAAAIDAVLGTVKGFWVNIPGRYNPQVAAEGLVQAFS